MPLLHRKPWDFAEVRGIASFLAPEGTMCHWENAYATTPHSAFVTILTINDLSL